MSPQVKIRCDHKTSFQACDWSAVNIPGPLLVETDFLFNFGYQWRSGRLTQPLPDQVLWHFLPGMIYLSSNGDNVPQSEMVTVFFLTFKMDKWKDWQIWGSVNDIEVWFLATFVFLNNFLIYWSPFFLANLTTAATYII